MQITTAVPAHIPGILALLQQVGLVHHNIRPDIFPEHTQKYDEDALLAIIADPTRPIFIAGEDGVLGYCFCVHKDIAPGGASIPRKELYIDDLCVDEACRGKGIAAALYRHAFDYAKAQGCAFVTLNCWNGNDSALQFYKKMGMHPRSITMEQRLC